MAPDDRRQEILNTARKLFAQQPYWTVSTGEVADAAGVARSLVHHYFGGIREVFLAVAADGAAALSAARSLGTDVPFEERTARNVAASLDVIADNRETWLAVVGHAADPKHPEIQALLNAAKDQGVARTLEANSDIVPDTPQARFLLRCFTEFSIAATRAWVTGDKTREETEEILLSTGRALLLDVIPSLSK